MARKRVYLGGRISGLSYEQARAPRREAAKLLRQHGLEPVDPMDKEKRLAGTPKLDDLESAAKLGVTFDDIIEADENLIERCDFYLLLTGNSPSWGTGIETGFARYVCGIPIVAVGNTSPPSGWLTEVADYIAESVVEAVLYIAARASRIPKRLAGDFVEQALDCEEAVNG